MNRYFRMVFLLIALPVALLQGCASPPVNPTPEALYQEGEQYFKNGKYQDAIAQWKKVKESFHTPDLTAKAEIGIADAYFLNKEYIEAAVAYEDFRKLHPSHAKAAHALYRQGVSSYNQITGTDTDQTPLTTALTLFESYRKQYPKGDDAADVLTRINSCRDNQLEYEIYVGRFYLKTGKYPAAIARFDAAQKSFPGQSRRDEVLLLLGKAYFESGQAAKGREVYTRLAAEYPASGFLAESVKIQDKYRE